MASPLSDEQQSKQWFESQLAAARTEGDTGPQTAEGAQTHTRELEPSTPSNDFLTPRTTTVGDEGRYEPGAFVEILRAEMETHPLWSCRLLRSCSVGHLTLADWRHVFSQYHLYSANFTRYLAAVMANCPSDYYRARLAENMWEEGGMRKPEERHAQIFRGFLADGLGVDPSTIRYDASTTRFVDQYLHHCLMGSGAYVSAFLSLGTEAIVPRLYGVFVKGLERAGVAEKHLHFFKLHMACDDEHAATLLDLMLSYAADPEWERQVRAGMRAALDLRLAFFEAVHDGLTQQRVSGIVRAIQERKPLGPDEGGYDSLLFGREQQGRLLYANLVERLNIEFAVERVPFEPEVLEPRLVHIPPGRCNERHKHAHESLFLILTGEGRVRIGDRYLPVRPGDMVFVPRWVLHQTENLSNQEMVILAVTDHGLTGKAFIGDYNRTARMKRSEPDASLGEPDK